MKPTKLLMIAILRSSAAALATPPRPQGGVVGAVSAAERKSKLCNRRGVSSLEATRNIRDPVETQRQLLTSGHIAFRLARRTDVPQIQKCNLATLPENYNANFYVNHMRAWPELTLVAEHIPEGCQLVEDEGDGSTITPLRDYWTKQNRADARPKKEIVGYILGKVEERPVHPQRQIFPPSRVQETVPLYNDYGEQGSLSQYANSNNSNGRVRFPSRRQRPTRPPTEKIGHVTSLAVHHHARRLGVASSLIHQLHYHLQESYGARSIGLHVRISNKAAVRLYCDDGYDVADIIPMYYGDGEDAYFMRKDFDKVAHSEAPSQPPQEQRQWRRGEKEREEWLNRDATNGGSFFDNRKSMRDTLSEEERAWVASNNNRNAPVSSAGSSYSNGMAENASNGVPRSPSLSGKFKQGFRTFFNGAEHPQQQQSLRQQSQRRQRNFQSPPWENGPEGLRLPRYSRVMRQAASPPTRMTAAAEMSRGNPLRELVTNGREEEAIDVQSYEEEDARVAS